MMGTHHGRDGGSGQGEPTGPLSVPEPQPTDHGHRCSEFDQQCDAHLQVADRVEVRELASGDRGRSVGGDHLEIAPPQTPPTAETTLQLPA
jgi:hypothetical protein